MMKWKEASSVILAAASPPVSTLTAVCGRKCTDLSKEKSHFQILALKKSSESPFVPGSYVFPGGTVSTADSSKDWLNLFTNFGYNIDSLCCSLNNDNTNLPLFEDRGNLLPRCISLRISAIREAFEESGILLCSRTTKSQSNTTYLDNKTPVKAQHFSIQEMDYWRKKVLKNSNEFFNLCKVNNCYPDITSLYLWSNWLTPSHIPVRFDSVFFIALLDTIVSAEQDNYEIDSLKWSTPHKLLDECNAGEIWLPVPQFYELSRLVKFNTLTDLARFSVEINSSQGQRWMPVRVYAKDGEISLLPGDEMYPDDVDVCEPNTIISENLSIDEFRCEHMHRMEHRNRNLTTIVISSLDKNKYKHVVPWCPTCDLNGLKGHL